MYSLIFTSNAEADLAMLCKSGDKTIIKRLNRIKEELKTHPRTGIGKPQLKKYAYAGCWSREISEKHRIVYIIEEETMRVVVLKAYGHYDDK
ncbi:MAG: Txe/YoeB family addiction module toxin [Tannerellaceae bacterium]|jgi:toxin YoeB|nr:Txe/YoeB family addiction module toxin [Tannerellaceae bacterium]